MITPEWLNVFTAIIFGLLVGSFLNVVIYRLPQSLFIEWIEVAKEVLIDHGKFDKKLFERDEEKEKPRFNIAFPPSHCPECKAPIKPWHNIPLISYFFMLKGKCYACNTPISLRYPIVELVTGILSGFIAYKFGLTAETAFVLVFTYILISLTMIDVDHHLLPDELTLSLLWLGLLVNAFNTFTDLHSAVVGAAAGYVALWSVYKLFKIITGKEGMGYGDFKLLAALGAWMGWQQLPVIIIFSSFVGAIIGIAGILFFGKDKDKHIPFGPYLAIAGWIAFFWGNDIISAYTGLFR